MLKQKTIANQLHSQQNALGNVTHRLPEAASLLLDVVRFSAALLVVAAHMGLPEFHTGLPDLQILGAVAVPVFFVLSGFIIRFVTRSREHTQRDYYIDRASRMYSVSLPAMLLTLLLAGLCRKLDRPDYMANFAAFSDHPLARILLNLAFLSQSWSHSTIPFINVPFWSLSYECLYYIAYGILFYLRGPKRLIAASLWAAVAGPQVIFLLPVWWLGVWLYDLYHQLRLSRTAARVGLCTLLFTLTALASSALGHPALARAPMLAVDSFANLPNPLSLLRIPTYRATMMAMGTGIAAAIFLLPLLFLSDRIVIARNRWNRRFRHLANGTFAIYLMHYPLMVLATAIGLLRPHDLPLNLTVVASICLLLILAARPLDQLKVVMRDGLRRVLLAHTVR